MTRYAASTEVSSEKSRSEIERIADKLSPTQRHCLLRFSEAEEWDRSGYGMARSWSDLVYGRRNAQFRSLSSLEWLGIADRVQMGPNHGFRLTPLGLSVQLHVRMEERGK